MCDAVICSGFVWVQAMPIALMGTLLLVSGKPSLPGCFKCLWAAVLEPCHWEGFGNIPASNTRQNLEMREKNKSPPSIWLQNQFAQLSFDWLHAWSYVTAVRSQLSQPLIHKRNALLKCKKKPPTKPVKLN